jgi:1,4-dihydroxy-6-naphthoate synthase
VLSSFIKENAQEMSEDIMRKHIDLYVNDFSSDLGSAGRDAVNKLIAVFNAQRNNPVGTDAIFLK